MTEQPKDIYTPRTLCEVCKNAYGDCPWSKKGVQKPVDGWDAIRNDLTTFVRRRDGKNVGNTMESYIVLDCPLFDLEERHRWAYEKFDRDAIREKYGKMEEKEA